MRWDFKGTNHKWRPYPYKYEDLGFCIKLHKSLGLNLVILCANFVNMSPHLFGEVGWGKSDFSFSCHDKSNPDGTRV